MSYFTRPFFALVETFWAVLPLVVAIDLLALFLLIFKEKKMDPRSFAFWVALIVVLPFLGFALYLLFGCSLYSVSIFGRKFGGDRAMGIMDDPRIRGADRATDGNDVRFYGEFPKVLPDLVDDVLAATSTVHLEFYKMPREGDIKALVEAVCQKGSEGLDIRFLLCRGVP